MIGVLDYKVGNPQSIVNMLDYLGIESSLVQLPERIYEFERIILPGVGHFDGCSRALRQNGFKDKVISFVDSGKPLLGICVGAQMLGVSSEEGSEIGLGIVDMKVCKFADSANLRIPRMEWGQVEFNSNTNFSRSLNAKSPTKFYFSHSYFFNLMDQNYEIAATSYYKNYTAAFEFKNVIGVQFHPEKSHHYGMTLLEEFAKWTP